MIEKEAERIVKILLTADGGCEYCVSSLLKLFGEEFPEFRKLAEEAFKDKFGVELEGFIRGSSHIHCYKLASSQEGI